MGAAKNCNSEYDCRTPDSRAQIVATVDNVSLGGGRKDEVSRSRLREVAEKHQAAKTTWRHVIYDCPLGTNLRALAHDNITSKQR